MERGSFSFTGAAASALKKGVEDESDNGWGPAEANGARGGAGANGRTHSPPAAAGARLMGRSPRSGGGEVGAAKLDLFGKVLNPKSRNPEGRTPYPNSPEPQHPLP